MHWPSARAAQALPGTLPCGARTFLEPKLASYKLPEAIRFVDAIPLTPMQKVDRRGLASEEARTTT